MLFFCRFVVLVLAISTTKAIRSNKLHDICQQQMELQKTSGAIEVYMDSLQWAMEDNLGKLKTKVRELEEKANRNEGIAKIQDYQAICLSYQRTMPEDCAEIYSRGEKNSGVYAIWPRFYNKPITVFCDMKTHGGGWTVFQRRDDFGEPRQDFFLEWSDYREGFGNLSGEFWLGNEALFALTNQDRMLLRVELEDFNETRRYAIYEGFIVRSEQEHYTMTYSTYEGDAGDSLLHSKDVPFTTRDKKNDFSDKNCAEVYKGAWWYRSCHESNLNGLYLRGHHSSFADGINWKTFKGYNYSLKFTEMKIRPKSFDTKRETK